MPNFRLLYSEVRTYELDIQVKESDLVGGLPKTSVCMAAIKNNWDKHRSYPAIEKMPPTFEILSIQTDPSDHKAKLAIYTDT